MMYFLTNKHGTGKYGPTHQHAYLDAYHLHISHRRQKIKKVLELGIAQGNSLRMWEEYCPNSSVVGIDILPDCLGSESPRTKVLIGDQGDKNFLEKEVMPLGPYDLIVDDGSHAPFHQVFSLKTLWPSLKDGGIYVIEDVEFSYEIVKEFLNELIDSNLGAKCPLEGLDSFHLYPYICFFYKKQTDF